MMSIRLAMSFAGSRHSVAPSRDPGDDGPTKIGSGVRERSG